jgi:phosphatidylserine decarboxylase
MITKYGIDNALIMLGVAIAFIIGGFTVPYYWLKFVLLILGFVLMAFALWFFRDPARPVHADAESDDTLIVSPADGKVVEIIPVTENEFLKSEATQISIFLSPLNVHVNYSPVTGTVEHYRYVPGEYLVAFHPKSSELNERTHVGMITRAGKIFFKQITGYVARRIVCEVKVGDKLKAGQQFGMMKFGSRMDLVVLPGTEIFVKVGDKVTAGKTLIARMKG